MSNEQNIFKFILNNGKISYGLLKSEFSNINESTLVRNLKKLLDKAKIRKIVDGKYTFYEVIGVDYINNYLQKPFFERDKVSYNYDFLRNYIPNESSFLGNRFEKINMEYLSKNVLSTYDYKVNLRQIENLIVDLSYSSSMLEGNTYSYLDTEVLIKYNESAEGKSVQETQMILNHKNAIKYIIDNRNDISYNLKSFSEIQTLLGKDLLVDSYLGIVRNSEVKIGGSTYVPLASKTELINELNLFFEKLSLIKNPFEQSLFILVFIPYFQAFMDINKRTSRISSNIPLIKNGLSPISMLQEKKRSYINAILSIYELNDTTLMRDLFVENYLLNFERYS